ncbi:Methionine aminopeptidase 2A [Nymphaea thermarum]|nr:Methionine aminopeptidase 2A [Nymphaea thermarum]
MVGSASALGVEEASIQLNHLQVDQHPETADDGASAVTKKKKKKKSVAPVEGTVNVEPKESDQEVVTTSTSLQEDEEEVQGDGAETTKKKKKKNKSKKKKEPLEQTDPPSIPVADLFPSGDFPEGEIQQYKDE